MATTKKKNNIKPLAGERWKELDLKKGVTTKRYAISNRGRIVSFKEKIDDGYLLRPRLTQGYPSVTIGREANRQNYYLHRLVAEYFSKKPTPRHNFVI
ncbi:MAG TPA: NUMOD4 domain-containing protein, partial [Chryseosolibacter sp.]|nr:NUMOD4 domain-containing protein [Chryseosolibacter sp.]